MKYRIGFRLNWLKVMLVLVSMFFAGIMFSGNFENKFIYSGLIVLPIGILLIKKIIKIPIK